MIRAFLEALTLLASATGKDWAAGLTWMNDAKADRAADSLRG